MTMEIIRKRPKETLHIYINGTEESVYITVYHRSLYNDPKDIDFTIQEAKEFLKNFSEALQQAEERAKLPKEED